MEVIPRKEIANEKSICFEFDLNISEQIFIH